MNARDWLDTSFRLWLDECPARLRNALKDAGKRTLRDVVGMTESEVLGLRNVGETSLCDLKHRLLALGLRLGELPLEPEEPKQSDMSLRDYFAGRALIGILANHVSDAPSMAAVAYGIADAMLDQRALGAIRQPERVPSESESRS